MRNVAPILPLKSKLSGKFQRCNEVRTEEVSNRSIEMLKLAEFSKISTKKNPVKHFGGPK